jgi:hypothetical protein
MNLSMINFVGYDKLPYQERYTTAYLHNVLLQQFLSGIINEMPLFYGSNKPTELSHHNKQ